MDNFLCGTIEGQSYDCYFMDNCISYTFFPDDWSGFYTLWIWKHADGNLDVIQEWVICTPSVCTNRTTVAERAVCFFNVQQGGDDGLRIQAQR